MSRNAVRVCVRTRPTHQFAQDNIDIDEEHSTIQITNNHGEEPGGMLNNRQNSFKFRFDHVFHNATQGAVYDLYARETVQGVIDGINGAVMTYGQTGSGKTFTMLGDISNYEHRGMSPRAIGQIFSEINSRIEMEFKVSVTYFELYNEKFFDLLSDLANPDVAADYTIAEERNGRGTFVRGLTEIEVRDENEALNQLYTGQLARTTAQHKLNRRSNRSHSVFTVYIQQRQRSGISEKVTHSKLHLIDLAGSERLKKTMNNEDLSTDDEVIRKESMSINQSLTYLEQCVVALSRKGSHVPYRQSRLTNMLKDCLGANCNTLMVACIWGENSHLEETVSTLRLASRMMKVQNETAAVETMDTGAMIKKQAKLIKALKQELLMHDALVERTGMTYEPYTPEQQTSIFNMAERYVEAPVGEDEDILQIDSYRQMLEICKQFKKMILTSRAETEEARLESQQAAMMGTRPMSSEEFAEVAAETKLASDFDPNAPMVGDLTGAKTGFSMGQAPADSRPIGGVEGVKELMGSGSPIRAEAKGGPLSPLRSAGGSMGLMDSPGPGSPGTVGSTDGFATGKSALFDAFIRGEGSRYYQDFNGAKSMLKDLKNKIRFYTQSVNEAKNRIDKLQAEIESRKMSRIEMLRKSGMKASETEDIVDAEEFQLMKDLRETKRSYKNAFEQLQKTRKSVPSIEEQTENAKTSLAEAFSQAQMMMQSGMNTGLDAADQLDDQEAFDRLEVQRVMNNDPDSLAFFHAQKTRRANMTQNSSNIKQMKKTKRFT